MRRLCPAHLLRDQRGATIVEFAMIAPVLLLTVMGLFDLGHTMYTNAQLQGAIQQAARKSTIEGASVTGTEIDRVVSEAVRIIAPGANITFRRTAYANFANVGRSEDWTDVDADGTCNDGEPFEDVNANGVWDADRGTAGFGGARDAVLYAVTVRYERPFPLASLIGQSGQNTMIARTVLRNQPYGLQQAQTITTGNCT